MTLTYNTLFHRKTIEIILDTSNDGINIVDTSGIIVYTNAISAEYANTTKEAMIGKHISMFYEEAVLLQVLKDKKPMLDQKIHYIGSKKYVVNSYPLFDGTEFIGAYSIFKDIRDIEALNRRISYLELHLELNKSKENILDIIGNAGSLESVLIKAKRTVGSLGGPRHSIITGQSGTGKTMLANLIYDYAKEVGVIGPDAPLIEVNCAQFTNPDIAAVEIFGSESGAYTGSKDKRGLFEQAHGGILFLDEAHALEHYQSLLLKVIESGKLRRIGGNKDFSVDVIIIAASTRNLKTELLPELYQRLAQYQIHLPSLDERSDAEKELLLHHFVKTYENAVKKVHHIQYTVKLSNEARSMLLKARYPRNIRQFRDIINSSIDAAAPLIADVQGERSITTYVKPLHIPFETLEDLSQEVVTESSRTAYAKTKTEAVSVRKNKITAQLMQIIDSLSADGLGPRRISSILKDKGYDIEYYQVAYYLKKRPRLI